MNTRKARAVLTISLVAFLTVSMGCTQPVTKREQGNRRHHRQRHGTCCCRRPYRWPHRTFGGRSDR